MIREKRYRRVWQRLIAPSFNGFADGIGAAAVMGSPPRRDWWSVPHTQEQLKVRHLPSRPASLKPDGPDAVRGATTDEMF